MTYLYTDMEMKNIQMFLSVIFCFIVHAVTGCVFDPSGIDEINLNNSHDNSNNGNNSNNNNLNNNNNNNNNNLNNNNNTTSTECGNGILESGEECDDGNLVNADGCSSECLIEDGWVCEGEPSLCNPVCGDGIVTGGEECDDGNVEDGDGCSSGCTVEDNFACWGEPSFCVCKVHVNTNNTSGISDGDSFDTGFLTVQEGIDRADQLGDCEVWVARGVYNVYENDSNDTITLADNVAVYGGFDGSETERPQRDWVVNETVLNGAEDGNTYNRVGNVITAAGASDTILDGFTIKAGNAGYPNYEGGGLLCTDSVIAISNCRFQDNNATYDGGGIYLESCFTHINHSTFSSNHAGWDGGGAFVTGGALVLDNCAFSNNIANWSGGGVYIENSASSEILNSSFHENSASWDGGGVYLEGGFDAEILNSSFHENNGGSGGGIYTNGGAPEILGCGFYKNTATDAYGGAGFHANFGDIVIRQSTFEENSSPRGAGIYFHDANGSVEASWFEGNTTTNYGGALYFRSCNSVELVNLVAWSNTSNQGGAVLNYECDLRVVNSTLYGNTAHSTGGAFYSYGTSAVTTIINSILWNNSPNDIADAAGSSTPVYYSNVSQSGYEGTNNNISLDPLFMNPGSGDFRLQPDSPCINAGNGNEAPPVDIQGNPRGDPPDMGAYEYQN